ncbi:MAG TPA: hypothetical protein VG519_12590 [Pseudochrobactrum sp.]|nr:hypothetical protein [Pseudochrobactrum sp.]
MNNTVILSTELHFNLSPESQHCDLWIVDTPVNLSTVEKLRSGSLAKSVTTFLNQGSAVMNILAMLPTVLDHHPDCTHIVVRGLASKDHKQVIQYMPELTSIASEDDTLIFKYDTE